MLNYLKLGNVGPSPSMEIEFRPRMNFLTGDNGLGKTFLLDIAWWVLTRTWAKLPAAPPLRAWKTPRGIVRGTASIAFGYEQASGGPLEFESIFNRGDQQWAVKRGRSAVARRCDLRAGGRRFLRLGSCAKLLEGQGTRKARTPGRVSLQARRGLGRLASRHA